MYKKILFAFMALAILAMVGCKKDNNDPQAPEAPERMDVTAFDDLEFFQDYFINVDSLGNFVSRSIGIPLQVYDEDTTHIFIGVENMEEALTYLEDCLPPLDEIQTLMNGNYPYTFTLTDEKGASQGTISFAPSTEPGFVADITTDLPGLRHFKKVTFVQNDSWPVDFTEGQYHFGDVRTFTFTYRAFDLDLFNWVTCVRTMKFVCLREKGRGVKPLYVAITPDEINIKDVGYYLIISDYCPCQSKAKMIYRLIDDYGFTNAIDLFKRAGEGELKHDQYYWYDESSFYFFCKFWHAIRLFDGDMDSWECGWRSPEKHALLKIDWLDE